jgi:serine O-acetyltransferase
VNTRTGASVATIQGDLQRYNRFGRGSKAFVASLLRWPGFRYTFLMRLAKYWRFRNILVYVRVRLMLDWTGLRSGFQISYHLEVGPGLYIGHYGTVIINTGAHLGRNVNLSPGVTIGVANRGRRAGVPVIGDDVWIGTNSVIVDGITIGSDVLIAPDSYVTMDIHDHSVVKGNPATVTYRVDATAGYIDFGVDVA